MTVRNDTGVAEGGEISLYYDPMIAKLVTHAKTRDRGDRGPGRCARCLHHRGHSPQHPVSRGDHAASALALGQDLDRLHRRGVSQGVRAHRAVRSDGAAIAGVAAAIDHVLGERKRRISGQLNSAVTRERRRAIWLGGEELQADVAHEGGAVTVLFEDGNSHVLSSNWVPGMPVWSGTLDGAAIAVHVRMIPNGFELAYRGVEVKAFVYTEREARYARLMPAKKLSGSEKSVRCPMPGLVVSLAVAEGQEVKSGETLAIIEAMKMENILRAERDGTIKKIRVKQGDSVAVDAVIMEFA